LTTAVTFDKIRVQTNQPPQMTTLTKENAHTANLVISKDNPEWGTKNFNFNSQGFDDDGKECSSIGQGPDGHVLFHTEYHRYEVVNFFNEEEAIKRNTYLANLIEKRREKERKDTKESLEKLKKQSPHLFAI